MAKKADKMAALCSAAIGAIYIAGYLVTDPGSAQAMQNGANPSTPAFRSSDLHTENNNNFTQPPGQGQQRFGRDRGRFNGDMPRQGQGQRGDAPTAPNGNSNTAPNGGTSTSQGQAFATPTAGKPYKDGTYTGTGSNRIGSVEVAVTIKSGKIAAVEITNCDTHYPQSDIDGLPAQAVERQSSNVDTVSGATKSTDDFRTAMNQALAQAQS
ncbi:FMN-binding protein [Tumebacillus flagellatus]|uniref:FMN-binding domain-containing protein n=1 Tax=Tumebacillus flagellatus TaxID=1157490 RepID=A0A074MGM3_9BACL|nr:FMN-binding protein [Tumebacillus flagellatus]KEO84872.1 hypothetical protein EL26_02355 [Tumebacillus flagellatus]